MSIRSVPCLLLLCLFTSIPSQAEDSPPALPNIILIYTDDQGYGDLGANNPEAKFATPHLDRLAAEGLNFTDAHSPDAVCTPSRYGLLTGRYCWRTRLKRNVLGADEPALIPADRLTLASLLRQRGYATAMVGKWHLGMDIPGQNGARDFAEPIRDMPLDNGFDYFYGLPASLNFGYLAWIEGRHTAQPPTLFTRKKPNKLPGVFSDYRITPPYDLSEGLEVAPDFDDLLCLTRFTEKALAWMQLQLAQKEEEKPFFLYLPYTSPHKPVIPRRNFRGQSQAGAYGDFMMETDHHIGTILSFLEQEKISDNTLLIVSSDNGPETTYRKRVATYGHDSAGPFRGGKRDVYEGGHRVPFLMRWPAGISNPGRICDEPICQTDLLATLAELVGSELDAHSGEDSVSFFHLLKNEESRQAQAPLVHHGFDGQFAIRLGDWKLLLPHGKKREELYHLAQDPEEKHNLAPGHPERVLAMKQKLTEIVTNGRSTPGPRVPNDTGYWDDLTWISESAYLQEEDQLKQAPLP
ncbi:arylsulfatase [Roseibacillus ishigakijimensis]|uniref:Arylsulfatase n=1 Tax=Roseibacillus ishigakijimensis TaxID=454146 RepID=A0A934RL73_9BACT|nr:arylsulfatase [Roseibacillus ishigakijimensis]